MPDVLVVSDGVTLGVNVTLPEDVGVGDGEQSVFTPVSKMPRYGDAAVHVVPAFALVQLARAFARVPDGMDGLKFCLNTFGKTLDGSGLCGVNFLRHIFFQRSL